MNIVFLGPPGAGKGTQAARLSAALDIAHVSTGDMLRAAVAAGSPIGVEAKGHLDRGALVPDEVIAGVVADRIQQDDCEFGFLLDGFPRTLRQAELLDEALDPLAMAIDVVILIDVADDELIRRLQARGQGRSDDQPDVIRHRLQVYAEQTAPLADLYAGRSLLQRVDGLGTIDEVAERVVLAAAGATR